jgi:4-hydroxybutyryl-CoA dehydratase / vinylacetyl-CoA-Delta-isomerase
VQDRKDLVQSLLDRGALDLGQGPSSDKQPGRCCAKGCAAPEALPTAEPLAAE